MTDFHGKTPLTFVAAEGPKTFLMSCRPCEGTGKRFWHLLSDLSVWTWHRGDRKCDVCEGRGVVRFESPDVPIEHGACHGTGRMRLESSPAAIAYGYPKIYSTWCRGCYGYGILSLSGKIINLTARSSHEGSIESLYEQFGSMPPVPIVPVSSEVVVLRRPEAYEGFITPCRFCDGTGKDPSWISPGLRVVDWGLPGSCRICRGTKTIRLSTESMPIIHRQCRGTGRRQFGDKPLPEVMAERYRTDPHGQESMRQLKVKGVGGATEDSDDSVVLAALFTEEEHYHYHVAPCLDCNGVGLIEEVEVRFRKKFKTEIRSLSPKS